MESGKRNPILRHPFAMRVLKSICTAQAEVFLCAAEIEPSVVRRAGVSPGFLQKSRCPILFPGQRLPSLARDIFQATFVFKLTSGFHWVSYSPFADCECQLRHSAVNGWRQPGHRSKGTSQAREDNLAGCPTASGRGHGFAIRSSGCDRRLARLVRMPSPRSHEWLVLAA